MTDAPNPNAHNEIRKSVESRAIKSAAALALGRPALILVNLVGAMILARLISPREYGLFGMVIVAVRLAEVFREMGLGTVAIQREHLSADQQAGLYWTNTFFALFIGAVMIACAPLIVRFYGEPALFGLTIGVALQFTVNGISTQHLALVKRQLNFKGMVIVQVVAAAAAVGAAAVGVALDLGAYALVLRTLVEAIINAVGLRFITGWKPGRPRGFKTITSELEFGLKVTFSNMAVFLSRQADNLIVGRAFGAVALAQYQKSYELMMMALQHVARPAAGIGISALSRLNGEPEAYKRAYFRMVEKITLLSVPFAVMLMGAPQVVVDILLGAQWQGAVPLTRIFGLVTLLQPLLSTVGWLLTTQNRPGLLLRGSIFNAVLDVSGFLIGAQWGLEGVALSYSAGQIVKTPLLLWYWLRVGHVSAADIYWALLTFCGPGVVATAPVYLVAQQVATLHPILALLCTGTVAVVTYFACLWCVPRGKAAMLDVFKATRKLRS